jgi:hypothetical protein
MTITAGTLGSLCGDINAMLGNRKDLLTYSVYPTVPNPQPTDKLMLWLVEAYREITLGYRFEELEKPVNDQMVTGIDVYKYPAGMRSIRAITLLFPLTTGNQEPRPIRRRHIRNIRRYQTTSFGPPCIYAPFNQGNLPSIIVRPVPDQGYQFIWDILVKPTILTPDTTATIIALPDDWIDILKWSTCLRGHTSLLERDKAAEIQTLLFGGYDPALGRKVPGQIRQRIASRDQTDIEDTEYGLQPMVRRYSNCR